MLLAVAALGFGLLALNTSDGLLWHVRGLVAIVLAPWLAVESVADRVRSGGRR